MWPISDPQTPSRSSSADRVDEQRDQEDQVRAGNRQRQREPEAEQHDAEPDESRRSRAARSDGASTSTSHCVRRASSPSTRSSIAIDSSRRRARAAAATAGACRHASCAPPSAIARPNGVDSPKNGIAISVRTPIKKPKPASAALSTSSPTVMPAARSGRRRRRASGAELAEQLVEAQPAGRPPWR